MQTLDLCRRCLPEAQMEEQQLRQLILERVALLPDGEKTGEAEYARRLALCAACGQLIHGTCAQCGCYVELRAAKRALRCAHANPKW